MFVCMHERMCVNICMYLRLWVERGKETSYHTVQWLPGFAWSNLLNTDEGEQNKRWLLPGGQGGSEAG